MLLEYQASIMSPLTLSVVSVRPVAVERFPA
ncbi:hypothetical protein VAB18032_14860 [Micromonospora maris AB-18-032]|nr:hypothetical protein VAB18032_14860 [Micromonospora maris AB-18-032]